MLLGCCVLASSAPVAAACAASNTLTAAIFNPQVSAAKSSSSGGGSGDGSAQRQQLGASPAAAEQQPQAGAKRQKRQQQAAGQQQAADRPRQQAQQPGQQGQYLYEGKYGLPLVRKKLSYSELLKAVRLGEVQEVHFFTTHDDSTTVRGGHVRQPACPCFWSVEPQQAVRRKQLLGCQGTEQARRQLGPRRCCCGGALCPKTSRQEGLKAACRCGHRAGRAALPDQLPWFAPTPPFVPGPPLRRVQMEGPCLVALADGTVAQSHIPDGDFRCVEGLDLALTVL